MELLYPESPTISLNDFWKLDAASQDQIIEREYQLRRSNNGLKYYEPNGKVEEFLKLVATTSPEESIAFILSAANGIGKTTFVVNLLGNIIFGPQNKYFDYPLFRDWPFPKRGRYITTTKAVEEIGPFNTEILRWWPKGKYEPLKGGKNYFSQYKANDWVIDVMTIEQEVKEFESGTLGLAIKDEPCPKDIHAATTLRLRMGGLDLTIMTPLTDAGWFFDDVVPRHERHIVYANMESACKEHGVRGHLEHRNIEAMIAEIDDPTELEARVEGKAMHLKGLIFKDFNHKIHVLKQPVQAQPGQSLFHVVDPHIDKPFAMIWATVDSRGVVTIVDEWPNVDFYKWRNCNLSIPDYKEIFFQKENGVHVTKRIIDRHFAEVRHMAGMTRKTLRDEFLEAGISFYPSYQAAEEISTGVTKVREYLRFNSERPIDSYNTPKLFINPHCFNTIKSLTRWSNDENGKFKEEFKDFCDVVRYLVVDNPQVEEPSPRFEPRKMWG